MLKIVKKILIVIGFLAFIQIVFEIIFLGDPCYDPEHWSFGTVVCSSVFALIFKTSIMTIATIWLLSKLKKYNV